MLYTTNLLSKSKLPLCPDVIEQLGGSGTFVVCSYDLDAAGSRAGAVGLCHVSQEAGTAGDRLEMTEELACDAVFDGRWAPGAPVSDRPLFCIATANAGISLYGVDGGRTTLTRLSSGVIGCASDDTLSALSIDWLDESSSCDSVSVVAGLSDGRIWLGGLDATGARETLCIDGAHTLGGKGAEVWTVAACPHNRNVVWSGGDDAKFSGWDTRCDPDSCGPIFRSSEHSAGVTSISWCPISGGEHFVLTGGYDDRLLIWDDRIMGHKARPIVENHLGGGVWRSRWRKQQDPAIDNPWENALAVACMYNGVAVLDTRLLLSSGGALPLLTKYSDHDSIVYGVAWAPTSSRNESAKIISSSFYDRVLHLWEVSGSGLGEN
jgi:diphthamide biosynthesis protein 7